MMTARAKKIINRIEKLNEKMGNIVYAEIEKQALEILNKHPELCLFASGNGEFLFARTSDGSRVQAYQQHTEAPTWRDGSPNPEYLPKRVWDDIEQLNAFIDELDCRALPISGHWIDPTNRPDVA